ncbi:MAG: hypothetical protein QOI96_877, partial [Verrucomicrobiota bacterium]
VDLVRRRLGKIDIVICANEIARARLLSVELNLAGANQLLNSRPRKLRKFPGEKAIQAQTGRLLWDDERNPVLFQRIHRG